MAQIIPSPAQAYQYGILYLEQDKALGTSAGQMKKVRDIYNYQNRNKVFEDIRDAFIGNAAKEPIVDLNKIASQQKQIETKAIGQLQKALIDLANSTIYLERTKEGNGGYTRNTGKLRSEHRGDFDKMYKAIKSAIGALNVMHNVAYTQDLSTVTRGQWKQVMSRFFRDETDGKMRAFADRIMNHPEQMKPSDLSTAIAAFGLDKSKGGQFGELFGDIVEEALPKLVLTNNNIRKAISKAFGVMVSNVEHISDSEVGAIPGTIRTTLNGKVNEGAIKQALESEAKLAGSPLRDAVVSITPTKQGARISVESLNDGTTGISIKWRKLTDKHRDIKLADLSMANFFPTIIQERASQGMYLLRELAAQGDGSKNGIMNWLLAHNLDAITRGTQVDSDITTQDLTDFMIINGKMMTVRKALSLGTPSISIHGLPAYKQRRWLPGIKGNAAANFISTIHNARVKAYLNVSRAGYDEIMIK